ncbi:IS110 family transposase [Roseospira marina]|uniref:IS110 family transposase n=1 Tax=Roseospira marina TaxID=140057 RepID=A0A5M6I8T0_9PROT|nr:IS110 family transposase [Roseospira marina]
MDEGPSIPGIARLTAFVMLIEMPELGTMEAGQAAGLAGLAPVARQSRRWTGRALPCPPSSHVRPRRGSLHSRPEDEITTLSSRPENPPKSPSPPSCETSSASRTPCSRQGVPGCQKPLDQHGYSSRSYRRAPFSSRPASR